MKEIEHHCQMAVAPYGATSTKRPNLLLVADTQQQVAASRRLLRAEQRQR